MALCEGHRCFRTATHVLDIEHVLGHTKRHVCRQCGEDMLKEEKQHNVFASVKLVALHLDRWAHPW